MNWGERGRNVLWKKRERGDKSEREGAGERKRIMGQTILEGEEKKARVGKWGKKRVWKSRRGRREVAIKKVRNRDANLKGERKKGKLRRSGRDKLKCRER